MNFCQCNLRYKNNSQYRNIILEFTTDDLFIYLKFIQIRHLYISTTRLDVVRLVFCSTS